MALNIKLTTSKPFSKIDTSIGKLYLFVLRGKEAIEIEKTIEKPIEDFSNEELLKFYIPLFSHLEQDLTGEELERPNRYTLKYEDVE